MEEFLVDNRLQHLHQIFIDQNIDEIGLLPLLSEEYIKLLIPAIGDQIKFKQALTTIASNNVGNNQTCPTEHELLVSKGTKHTLDDNLEQIDDTLPVAKFQKIDGSTPVLLFVGTSAATETGIASASTITDLRNSDCGLNSSCLSVYQDIEKFDLKTVLEGDAIGRAILSKHTNSNVSLTNRDRNNICEIIISYFLNKVFKLNNDSLSRIADEIITIIPTEKKTTYFVSPIKKRNSRFHKPEVAKAKLVDKHRNKLTALRRAIEFPPVPVNICETITNEPSQTARDSKIWLSHNREPVEDVLIHWKNSYEIRNTTIESFFNKWPFLGDQLAIELVTYDFQLMFQLEVLTTELENSFKLFFDGIPHKRRGILNATDETFIQLLEGNITTDSKTAIKLYLLFSLLPPKGRMRLAQKQWKPSKLESRDVFFLHVKVPGDIERAKQEKIDINYKRGTTVQPYIILVGSTLNCISACYVIVNENIYKTISVLDAVDFCFKVIHVLDARYPFECQHVWYLIQWLMYKIQTKNDLKIPYIQDLL